MTTLTPVENGLHSLAKGLEAFGKLHHDPSDVFALKDAVLRTHHAIETLTKATLFDINPVFVLKAETKIGTFISRFEEFADGKNSFIIDEEFTIGLTDALDRLRSLGELREYPDREFFQLRSAVKELEVFRNAIQHFAINANVEIVARVLGNVVPRFVDLLEVLFQSPRRAFGFGYSVVPFRHTTANLPGFRTKLDEIYPESGGVLVLLRSRYDDLIRRANEFFSGREFPGVVIKATVRDHGKVGPRPYMPEIALSGGIELAVDAHRLIFLATSPSGEEQQARIEAYEGSVTISNPVKGGVAEQDLCFAVTGSIELRATIALGRADSAIRLPGAEEFVSVLRDIDIKLSASLRYNALALYDQAHYQVQKILTASGALELTITAVPAGYDTESKKHLVSGIYGCELDEKKAPFTLFAFVEPDGGLRDHHSLDWTINTKSVLRFAK